MLSLSMDIPCEALTAIYLRLHSLQEVHNLGLTYQRLHAVLLNLGYYPLCQVLLQLPRRHKSSDLISRSLAAAEPFA